MPSDSCSMAAGWSPAGTKSDTTLNGRTIFGSARVGVADPGVGAAVSVTGRS
jgi:hypothetical protein